MSMSSAYAPVTPLLELPDVHGALLANFNYYPTLDLLAIVWHGHLTADALVRGTEAGMRLFAEQPLPQRLLSNHAQVTGEWAEALPWLQYEWLPEARARGVHSLAHVLAQNTTSEFINYPGGQDFVFAVTHELRAASFRQATAAWQWLVHH